MALPWPARSASRPCRRAGLLAPTSPTTLSMIEASTAAGTLQIVTRRHGPCPSAVENSEVPFCAVQASQYRKPS